MDDSHSSTSMGDNLNLTIKTKTMNVYKLLIRGLPYFSIKLTILIYTLRIDKLVLI